MILIKRRGVDQSKRGQLPVCFLFGGIMMKPKLAERLWQCFQNQEEFTLQEAYASEPDMPKESVRARIYENLGRRFEKIARGVYSIKGQKETCILLEGDGRDLSFLKAESIDCIIADHPWLDQKSNHGGNRAFAEYDCFRYTEQDFQEKARVLKEGCFLIEILPEENSSNFEYLYEVKKMAEKAGFIYYSKVPWKKGSFVSNTGRKAKNMQDIMFFSKGKARSLRPDKKRMKELGKDVFMSGAKGMLPACFDIGPVKKTARIHQSEMPCSLLEQIMAFVTTQGEVILDQFAGSGVVGETALRMKRSCILIEKLKENVENIQKRFQKLAYI